MQIDWAYLRSSWKTSAKTREFLGSHKINITETINAHKEKIGAEAAWALLKSASVIYVVNGRKVSQWQPSTKNKAAILGQAIGRSGNLRAPTIRHGDTFIIGYDEALYQKIIQ